MPGVEAPDGALGADLQPVQQAVPNYRGAPLPPSCPPGDAGAPPEGGVFLRLVPTDVPTANDFRSCALEGKTPPIRNFDPCTWQATSFFAEDTPPEKLFDIASYKNHRDKKFVAHIRVTPADGVMKIGPDGQHISFWMYDTFAPETCVDKVEAISKVRPK